MELYKYKPLNVGFVAICPDPSVSALRVTVNSARKRYDSPCVAAVPENIDPQVLEGMQKICPVHKGLDTITSLINVGMDHGPADWNMTVMAGTWVRANLDKKYSYFVESETDILYAIVNGFYEFVDCSLNGIMIHKDTWKKVGHFCPQSPLAVCKLFWAEEAIRLGHQFKGIIGTQMI
jgi:hypothetical protein